MACGRSRGIEGFEGDRSQSQSDTPKIPGIPHQDAAGVLEKLGYRPNSRDGILAAMRYTTILESQPDSGYHAFCPTLPGCHSEGDTLDQAIENIREAVTVYLDSLTAYGEPLPIEDILIKPLDVTVTA